MKRKNFIIQFVIIALVLVTGVGSSLPDVMAADDVYDKTLSVVETLGINENIQKGASYQVTRSEFVAMTVRLLNIGSLGYTDYYTDVTEASEFANEISVAKKLGIAGGVSDSEFFPGASVTYAQATKMVVCALGLDQPARVGGGYPFGYMKVAENLDILDDISYNADMPITYRDAIVLIYNALFSSFVDVDKVAIDSPESILYYKKSDVLFIEHYFNYRVIEGVVWSAGKASMHMNAGDDGILEVNGERFVYNGSDIADYLGLDVMLIVDKNDKAVAVVATERNTVHAIKSDDIADFSQSRVSCYVGDKEKTYSFASDYIMLHNWRASSATEFDFDEATLVIIDNNGDGRFDVIHVQKAETMIVSNVSGNMVSDKYSGRTVTLPDEVSVVKGDDQMYVSPEELVANMILSVYLDDNGDASHVVAGYDILHGATVTAKQGDTIYIDDEPYELSSYFKKYFNYNVEIGTRVTIYYDSLGKICYIEKYISKDSGGMEYGFLIGTKFGGGFGDVHLNILTSDGETKAFALKDKIVLDGVSVMRNSDEIKSVVTRDGLRVKYGLIKYAIDADELITKIDTAEERTSSDFAEKYAGTGWENDNSLTLFVKGANAIYRGAGSFFPYCIYNNPVVFEVPTTLATQPNEDYDAALFSVRTKGFVDNDKCTLDLYDYDSAFSPAVIVNYAAAGSGIRPIDVDMYNDPIAVVTDVSQVLNSDGDETIGLKLLQNGREVSVKLASKIIPYFEEKNLVPENGDIIQYAVDALGDIAGITLFDYNPATGIFNIDYSKTGDKILDGITFISGKVYSVSSTHIVFAASTKPNALSGVDYPDKYFVFKVRGGMTVTSCNIAKDEFRLGSLADIATIDSVGEANASDVIMQLSWGTPLSVVVYN